MEITGVHYLRQNTQLNGRYTIHSVLGEGGFGITYFALDDLFGKRVAIKEFFPRNIVFRNSDFENSVSITSTCPAEAYYTEKKKFIKEAKAMARFQDNRGIVDVMDFFEANNTAYIVMEYLDGVTLKKYLEDIHVIRPDYLQELVKPIIRSLYGMHQVGMIHRDLSPDNIMVLKNGEIKLMDFGAARNYTSFGDRGLTVVVKHGYSPMEQYQSQGVQGPWTDIYALSAILYRCLTGQKPPMAMDRIYDDELRRLSEYGLTLPAGMEKAIMKGLQVRPENRYQNLRDFWTDFYGETDSKKVKDSPAGQSAAVSTETEEEKKKREKAGELAARREKDKQDLKKSGKTLGKILLAIVVIFLCMVMKSFIYYLFIPGSGSSSDTGGSSYVSSDDSQNSDGDSDSSQSSNEKITQTDDWRDGIFTMDGKTYQLPMKYSELTDDGWSYAEGSRNEGNDNEDTALSSMDTTSFFMEKEEEGYYIIVTFINATGAKKNVKDCEVYGVAVYDLYFYPTFSIAKGITLGWSEDQIREELGEPSRTEEVNGMDILYWDEEGDASYASVQYSNSDAGELLGLSRYK